MCINTNKRDLKKKKREPGLGPQEPQGPLACVKIPFNKLYDEKSPSSCCEYFRLLIFDMKVYYGFNTDNSKDNKNHKT